jgi:vitamin B12 transporter
MNSCHLRTAGRGLPRRPVVVLLSTILSLSGASALAQTAPAPATPAVSSSIAASYSTAAAPAAPAASAVSAAIELPGIVVSATGDPTPAADVGSSVTVITADQIAAQQRRTLPDVLNQVPGLNVVQSGGPGTETSVFIWGTNSNHVKVLIDGIDASDPSNPNDSFDFSQMLTGDIARIEVLRGPQSGLYGSDAIGGVISITTKSGSGPPKATASIEGGSFGTFNERLGLSGSSSIFNYSFNVQHLLSTDTPDVPQYLLPVGQRVDGNLYDNQTYSTRIGADLTDTLSINAIARYTYATLLFTSDLSGACGCMADATRSMQIDRQFYNREEAVWHTPDKRFITTLGVNYSNVATFSGEPAADMIPNSTFIGQRLTFDLKQEIQVVPGEKLILGGEAKDESANTGTQVNSQSDRAVYAELESSFFNSLFIASNVRFDDYSSFGGHFTFRVTPAYTIPVTETKLMGSVGTGFKAPTLSELYQNFPAFDFVANPNLKPEESTGFDVGFEQPFLNNRVRVGRPISITTSQM